MNRAGAAVAALAAAGCEWRRGALDPAGPGAAILGRTWWIFFWVCAAVFVLVLAATVVAFVRGVRSRSARGDDPEPEADPRRERAVHRAVTVSSAVSVAGLAGLLVVSVVDGRAAAAPVGDDPLRVLVTAQQWWWKVEYEGPEPSARFVTANELHVPVGRAVELQLRSADVIHSLWVPNLHGKRDLVPGHVGRLVIRADRAGTFPGRCAEFCGLQHARMNLVVVAEPPERFRSWVEAQRRPAAEPGEALARRGREVFLRNPCSSCHAITGTDAFGSVAPDLTHVASRSSLAAGSLPNGRDALRRWIEDPQAVKPGTRMPRIALGASDLDALVAYLETLR